MQTLSSRRASKPASTRACAIALVAFASAGSFACNDDPRIPDEDRFAESTTGVPGVSLIDDMEDGTQYLLSDNGRVGLWYVYNDASTNSTQEPSLGFPMYRVLRPDGSADPSSEVIPRPCGEASGQPFFATEELTQCEFVARTWGTGQRGWGAGVGLDLNGEGGLKNPIDASEYGGIGFFITGNVRNNRVRVNVQDVRTTPESATAADREEITRCESYGPDGTATTRCNDHYGYQVTISPTQWTWIEIPFSCMRSGGWGYPAVGGQPQENALLTSAIVGVQFQIEGADPADTGTLPAGATVLPFDFSIDNLSFLETSHLGPTPQCP
jgi:hypothetical protein